MSYYFDKKTDVISNEVTTKAIINNNVYTFKTDNNVFSKRGLDFATRLLLESLNLDSINGNVLDFGCGYGPIGIYIKLNTEAIVDMIDINERALSLTRKNAKLNNADVNIFESNLYNAITKKYDYIITNPPIRVGKKILYEILINAKKYLNKNGHLIFVLSKDKGAKSTIEDLKEYYNVYIKEKSKGIFVIDCQNY